MAVVDHLAIAVLKASSELVRPGHMTGLAMSWEQARQFTKIPGLRAHILEKIQIDVAWEYANDTEAMADRCLQITDHLLKLHPREPVLRFLRRLTRCFVAGFHSETIILCRAVLENALVDIFERERKSLPTARPGQSEMSVRLTKAEEYGWLTRRLRTDAWTVWKRGSKAVHEDPTVTTAAMDTIARSVAVLVALYSPKGHAA